MALNNKTAFSKRAEQLKRYEDSETNRESIVPKTPNERKVRFSTGCIFLAACAAGDKDEVLNMLNSGGADIDTANVDGLTALHQVSPQIIIFQFFPSLGCVSICMLIHDGFKSFKLLYIYSESTERAKRKK